jgi:hypothetical protein
LERAASFASVVVLPAPVGPTQAIKRGPLVSSRPETAVKDLPSAERSQLRSSLGELGVRPLPLTSVRANSPSKPAARSMV